MSTQAASGMFGVDFSHDVDDQIEKLSSVYTRITEIQDHMIEETAPDSPIVKRMDSARHTVAVAIDQLSKALEDAAVYYDEEETA